MSLKPKKVSEIKKIQEKMKSKASKMDAKISSMFAMVPATRVFELVEELEGYLNN